MQLEIRKMKASDIGAVNRIYNDFITLGYATARMDPLPLTYHEKWFKNHQEEGNPILIATINGELAGWNALSYYRSGRRALNEVRESSYYIARKYWNLGIAVKLMDAILEEARNMKLDTLLTFIMGSNEVSIHLMGKFGFEEWGKLPGIIKIQEREFDHLIFGKKIK